MSAYTTCTLIATNEFFSILIEIYSKIKDVLAKFTKISLVGILFRFTVEAIVAIMHNPRKWNLDIGKMVLQIL